MWQPCAGRATGSKHSMTVHRPECGGTVLKHTRETKAMKNIDRGTGHKCANLHTALRTELASQVPFANCSPARLCSWNP